MTVFNGINMTSDSGSEGSHPLALCQLCDKNNSLDYPMARRRKRKSAKIVNHIIRTPSSQEIPSSQGTISSQRTPSSLETTSTVATLSSQGTATFLQDTYSLELCKHDNCIVDIENLREVVESELRPCNICKGGKLELRENKGSSFATPFRLSCVQCETRGSRL